jgi:hypothetical protein
MGDATLMLVNALKPRLEAHRTARRALRWPFRRAAASA